MDESAKLFDTEQSQMALSKAYTWLNTQRPSSEFEKYRNQHLLFIWKEMREHPQDWNLNCQLNIGWIGETMISRMTSLTDAEEIEEDPEKIKRAIDRLFAITYRFLLEFYLSVKANFDHEFENARQFPMEYIDHFGSDARRQLEYAFRDMPIGMLKALLSSDQIVGVKNFDIIVRDAETKKQAWDEELNEREKRVGQISEALRRYETAFNFVGLYQGFDELAKEKVSSLKKASYWLQFFGVSIFGANSFRDRLYLF